MKKRYSAGFFTLGIGPDAYDLPHDRLGIPVILLVRKVLCRAFEILREEKYPLAAASEDQVTQALRSVIENKLRQTGSVSGFSRHTFESVVRQSQVANFDGKRIAKTPDLCFKLRGDDSGERRVLSEYDALFVECKPVDSSHPAGSKYCDDGLVRFVAGDYAWAMQEGMMLAYVRNGRTISRHLIPEMSKKKRMKSLGTSQPPQAYAECMPAALSEALHISRHCRNFKWPHGKGTATEITIYHLWHNCT